MMKMKKLISVCLSLGLVCTMAACSTKPSDTSPQQSEEEFVLRVGIEKDSESLDPSFAQKNISVSLLNYLFEGLMRYESEDGGAATVQCGQAEDYTISDDGLTYRFVLRDDIFWSDGKPIVAMDFAYSWQRLVDPSTDSKYGDLLSMVENAEEIQQGTKEPSALGVKAIDEKTFEVKLAKKCSYFLEICALGTTSPVRKDVIEANGKKWSQNPQTLISNGAYTLETWERDDKLVLVKNQNYYDVKNIGPDRLDFSVIGDSQQSLSLFTNKQLDVVIDISKNTAINMVGTEQLQEFPITGLSALSFDVQKYPFTDPKIRQAFSLAIDRNAFEGTPLGAFVPYGVTDSETGADFRDAKEFYFGVQPEDYAANCAEAKKLLAEAGFANGENFPNIRYVYPKSEYSKKEVELLSKNWEEVLGVKVEVIDIKLDSWLYEPQDYHITPNTWIADYNDPTTFLNLFEITCNFDFSNYKNPLYDELLKEATDAATVEERYAILHEAEDILFAEHAVAPLYNLTLNNLVQDNITGLEFIPTQTITLKHAKLK